MQKWIGAALAASLIVAVAMPSIAQNATGDNSSTGAGVFSDVTASWVKDALDVLVRDGIIEGRMGKNGHTTWSGSAYMTRNEVAVALARLITYADKAGDITAAKLKKAIEDDATLKELLTGPAGAQGAPGATGLQGTSGLPGNSGERGAQGDRGEKGDQGMIGPVGPKGDPGISELDLQKIKQMLAEFKPDIEKLQSDVAALKANAAGPAVSNAPSLTVDVNIQARYGLAGPKLSTKTDDIDDQYNQGMYNSYYGPDGPASHLHPLVDPAMAKDSLKGDRFGEYLVDVLLNGQINPRTSVHADLRVISPVVAATPTPTLNNTATTYFNFGQPTSADDIQLWDYYATYMTGMFNRQWAIRTGKQSTNFGEGLLINTDRQPVMSIALDSLGKGLLVGVNAGFLDRTDSPYYDALQSAQDTWSYAYLGYGTDSFDVKGAYLASGLGGQQGWSLDGNAHVFGARLFGEYAELTKDISGIQQPNNHGWVAGADLLNNWHGLSFTGKYGALGQNYTPYMSSLYPYSSVNAFDTDWVDRPLFLDPNNIKQGWEGVAKYQFAKTWALKLRVYGGNSFDEEGNTVKSGAPIYVATLSKQLTDAISADLTYGYRHFSPGEQVVLDSMINNLNVNSDQMIRFGVNMKL